MNTSAFVWRCGLATVVAALTIGCSNPAASRDKYFAQGNAAFDTHAYGESILAYRNALKADPKFAPARQKLALALQRTGDIANSAREYVRAADLLPQDVEAQLAASKALLRIGQFEDAGTRAKKVLALDARNVDAHIVLGSAIAATKDLDGALEQIQEAIDIDPGRSATHASLGGILLAKGNRAEAQASFEKAVALDPKSTEARLALATFHLSVGDAAQAEAAIKGALSIAPADGQVNRAMALLLMGTGRAPEAEPYVKAAVTAAGTPQAELSMADYYLRMKKTDAAQPILQKLAGSEALFVPATIRLAAIEYAEGRRADAYQRIDDLLKRVPGNPEALATKGGWLLAEGRSSDALPAVQAAVKANPKSATAQFLLGRTLMATGDRHGAEQAFGEVLQLNPRAAAAQTELARLSLASGKTQEGVQFAQDAIASQPGNIPARVLLVRGLIARRELERASKELSPLLQQFPDHPAIIGLNGMLLTARKDDVGARREFERALAKDANQLDAMAGLTLLDAKSGQLDRARARLNESLKRTPDNVAVLILAAQADLQARDFPQAEARLRHAIDRDPSNQSSYSLLVRTYMQQQKLDEARRELEGIVQRQPSSVGALTLIATILEVQQRPEEAEKMYRRVLEVDPTAPVAANNLAYRYADRNERLEEALALAQSAAVRLKDHPDVMDTLGWVYYKKGRADQAIPQFEGAIARDPAKALYRYHIGLAYIQAGEEEKATRALEEALRLNPSSPDSEDARQRLARLKGLSQ